MCSIISYTNGKKNAIQMRPITEVYQFKTIKRTGQIKQIVNNGPVIIEEDPARQMNNDKKIILYASKNQKNVGIEVIGYFKSFFEEIMKKELKVDFINNQDLNIYRRPGKSEYQIIKINTFDDEGLNKRNEEMHMKARKNYEYFENNESSWNDDSEYCGKYVAILDETVIDSDEFVDVLTERVYKDYYDSHEENGDIPVYIDYVGDLVKRCVMPSSVIREDDDTS